MVVPYVPEFLYRYGESSGPAAFPNVIIFVGFVLQLLAFGAPLQLPLAMYAAAASGIVGARFWRSNVQYTVVAIAVFGAAITSDGSGVTMLFIAWPMIIPCAAGMAPAEERRRRMRRAGG